MITRQILFVCLTATIFPCLARVTSNISALIFLQHYGYLAKPSRPVRNIPDLTEAIRKYQQFFNLTLTGTLNNETLVHMNSARCGNADLPSNSTNFELLPDFFAPQFNHRALSYRITKYPVQVDEHTTVESVNEAAKRAFGLWSSVCDLEFYQTDSDSPDIVLRFDMPSSHASHCYSAFDETVLAHYIPASRNPAKTHYNDAHYWKTSRYHSRRSAVNLVSVIAHEVGHVLGFAHTNVPNSIMFPTIDGTPEAQLGSDDIAAAISRYGAKPHPTTSNELPPFESDPIPDETPIFDDESGYEPATVAPATNCPSYVTQTYPVGFGVISVCAILYDYQECNGDKLIISTGHHELQLVSGTLPFQTWADRVSSLELNPDCRIDVCTLANGQGSCEIIYGGDNGKNVRSLSQSFDNNVVSVTCNCV